MYLPLLTFFSHRNNWWRSLAWWKMASESGDEKKDEWFHGGEGRWGLRRGSADTVTNTLSMATKPGRTTRGRWGGTSPLWLFCRCRLLHTAFFLLQSWCPARRTVESGSRPASRSFGAQRFYRCEGALSGNVEAKRTCAVRWEAPAGDFLEHCRRPGFPGWDQFFPCRRRAQCHTAERQQMFIRMNSMTI